MTKELAEAARKLAQADLQCAVAEGRADIQAGLARLGRPMSTERLARSFMRQGFGCDEAWRRAHILATENVPA